MYGWAMSQNLPTFRIEWVEDTSKFTEDFTKNYNEKNEKGHIFEFDIKYTEKLQEFHMGFHF